MYCKYCGNKLIDTESFCTNCGKKNDSDSASGKTGNSRISKGSARKKHTLLKVILIAIAVIAIAATGLVHHHIQPFYSWYNQVKELFSSQKEAVAGYELEDYVEPADEYYTSRGKVISVTEVRKSHAMKSAKEFISDLSDRGFDESYCFAQFDGDGNYIDTQKLSEDSDNKYCVIEAFAILKDESLWHLYELDGSLMAYPVGVTKNSDSPAIQVVVSESPEIISFDSVTKTYYRTVPNENELKVIVVKRIDQQSLIGLGYLSEGLQ